MTDINSTAFLRNRTKPCDLSEMDMVDDPMEIDSWQGVPVKPFSRNVERESMIKRLDSNAGVENRAYYSELVRTLGIEAFSAIVDQIDVHEAEWLEECIIFEINRSRSEFRLPPVQVSDLLTQAAKSQSQFFCGNCLRFENIMPFQFASYSLNRLPKQKPGSSARMLGKYWQETKLMDELLTHCLGEIGVGVWGCSTSFVITIVKNVKFNKC